MTYYLNLRAGGYGALCSPYVLRGDGLAASPSLAWVNWEAVPILAKGKDVLLAAHGFNVSYEQGLRSLAHLEDALAMRSGELFLGVLWPGDFAIPAVNYPVEDKIATHGGRLVGDFCNRRLKTAASLSFLSHSLGARVILEAIAACDRPVRRACITAGAVNDNCLVEEYADAARNCGEIRTLSSRQDMVLSVAYPPGDALADSLDPDHPPFEGALGRGGPRYPWAATIFPTEIFAAEGYDHGDYFPPDAPLLPPPATTDKWRVAVRFMASAFRGEPSRWP